MIHTLLDNDLYNFTMSALISQNGYGQVPVKYAFRNRTFAVPLASRISLDELRRNIEDVRTLSFTDRELDYVAGLGYFSADFIAQLSFLKLPEVDVREDNGHLVMEYEGPWQDAIFWETPLLSMVNELYFREFGAACHREGNLRLHEKITYLKERGTLRFVEFGSRRRFSAAWQEHVLTRLLDTIPDLVIGTSNVQLAKVQGISPVGTMAHQLFMVLTALEVKAARQRIPGDWILTAIDTATRWVLTKWADMYAPALMTALPDTYTTPMFFQGSEPKEIGPLLEPFTSFRQDSGDPILAGETILDNYWRLTGMDPKHLMLVFSDGLDVRRMSVIEDNFRDRCNMSFGWGTNLTNDLGIEPLSIVIKPDQADGEPCVKTSDDMSKATGEPHAVALYREAIEG